MAFNTAPGRAEYTASAAQTIFTFPFKIFNTSDVKVYLTPVGQTADDTTDLLIETTDYTISINGDDGGDVDLTSGATLNDSITLVRELPTTRTTEYQQNGDLTAEALNEDQDYQTYLILDGATVSERALTVPDSVQSFNTEIPSPVPSKLLVFNGSADGFDLLDPASTSIFKDSFIVDNIAALGGVDPNVYNSVIVRGYYIANDGGGDLFNYDATQSAVNNGGTIINGWVRQINNSVTPLMFGADNTGTTDSTTSLQSMFNSHTNIDLLNGTYKFSELAIPDNIHLKMSGVLLADDTVASNPSITIGSNFIADNLIVESLPSAANFNIIESTGNNILIDNLIVVSSTERIGTGGCRFLGNYISIKNMKSQNIARPLAFEPTVSASNIYIGSMEVDTYIRALKFNSVQNFNLINLYAKVAHSGASQSAGHNGILIEGCNDFNIGECYIANSGEHALRIGGEGATNFTIDTLNVVDSGGCGMKFNPDVGFEVSNGTIGTINGVNVGNGSGTGNVEVVRLTRVNDCAIGIINATVTCTRALILADVTNLYVEQVTAKLAKARIVEFDETQDASSLVTDNVIINQISGSVDGGRAIIGFKHSTRAVGNIYLGVNNVTGYTNYLVSIDPSPIIMSDAIIVEGYVNDGELPPNVENVPDDILFMYDLSYGNKHYKGRAFSVSFVSPLALEDEGHDPAVAPTRKGAIFLNAESGTSAAGAYGGSIEFSRVESGRRGAGIAIKQIDTDQKHNGLSFMVQSNSTTANEGIQEKMVLKHTGTLNVNSLQTFADDAAAGVGGLVQGDLYITATGAIRMKL